MNTFLPWKDPGDDSEEENEYDKVLPSSTAKDKALAAIAALADWKNEAKDNIIEEESAASAPTSSLAKGANNTHQEADKAAGSTQPTRHRLLMQAEQTARRAFIKAMAGQVASAVALPDGRALAIDVAPAPVDGAAEAVAVAPVVLPADALPEEKARATSYIDAAASSNNKRGEHIDKESWWQMSFEPDRR